MIGPARALRKNQYLKVLVFSYFVSSCVRGFTFLPFLLYTEGEFICFSVLLLSALTEIIFLRFPEESKTFTSCIAPFLTIRFEKLIYQLVDTMMPLSGK